MNKHRWQSFVKFERTQGIEALVFALVLLFLPVNLAKHFFFNFAYIGGILVDYLIPTVYLTDILIWGLLGFWVFRGFSLKKIRFTIYDLRFTLPIFFLLISGLSIFSARNQPAAVYKWLKLLEYILFSFYVSKHIDLKKDFSTIVKLLSVGVLFESVLAIAQWFKQGSIFGYYFFGENKYTVSTPGIAVLDFTGIRKARPYGTFPHPNVLGGYLAVVLPWILHNLSSKFKVQSSKSSLSSVFYLLSSVLGLAALYLSFSRSAWVVGGLGVVGVLVFNFKNFPSLRRFFFLSSVFSLPSSVLNSLSFLRRAELNWIALEMIKNHPLLGVGLNNFTVAMDKYGEVSGWVRFLQPVHNVYLLIASEIGLIGLALFLCLLFSSFKLLASSFRTSRFHQLLLISMIQVVLLCFVDHYFWSLQQTSLLFWLLVGLVFAERNEV